MVKMHFFDPGAIHSINKEKVNISMLVIDIVYSYHLHCNERTEWGCRSEGNLTPTRNHLRSIAMWMDLSKFEYSVICL